MRLSSFFLCWCTLAIDLFSIDNNTFCERGCRDMNLRKANCNNDMGADKNVNIIYDIQE